MRGWDWIGVGGGILLSSILVADLKVSDENRTFPLLGENME